MEREALTAAVEALESIALAGMSGSSQETEEGMRDWHARRAWEFIGIAANACETVRAAKSPAPVSREPVNMPQHWCVVVMVDGDEILSIGHDWLSGSRPLEEGDEKTIIGAAQHLLSFVGFGLPAVTFDPEDGSAPVSSQPIQLQLLAADHTDMRVDYSGLLGQCQRALGPRHSANAEMLRQLQGHLKELGQRWYAGDVAVVDEILQLYCIEREARAGLKAARSRPMPIKPENRARYPADWKEIRVRILQRARYRCEHEGCTAVHREEGYWQGQRFVRLPKVLRDAGFRAGQAVACDDGTTLKVIRIILTVAHLDHTPENCDDANLRAWCQRHHLAYDAEHHKTNSRATRRARLGNLELPLEMPT